MPKVDSAILAPLTFPPSFLFGTATASTQVEGGDVASDWMAFAREPGRVKGSDTPRVACDHWNRFRDDAALQRSLGYGAYRMSVEWARIEPRPGVFDTAALDHYRAMLGALVDAGITPMVTLHHFSLPTWLTETRGAASRAGLLSDALPALLARYSDVVVRALGDLCRLWVTINEPNVVVAQGYLMGHWPPAAKSPVDAIRAHQNMLEAHVAMYRALHGAAAHVKGNLAVGVAHHLRVMVPDDSTRAGDRVGATALRSVFNDAFARAVCDGTLYGPLDRLVRSFPRGGFDVREAKGTQDFFGVNYYSRDRVRLSLRDADQMFLPRGVEKGAEVSDLGWEVYPDGLGTVLREWSAKSGVPLYVTENGIADARDIQRPSFLVRHLAEVARAIARGVDVRGYFHWSLMDNFEWDSGYEPRFGLVAIDYATQTRTPRPSAALYGAIAKARAIDGATWSAHGAPPPNAKRAPR